MSLTKPTLKNKSLFPILLYILIPFFIFSYFTLRYQLTTLSLLQINFKANSSTQVQVYYDLGNGFNEKNSLVKKSEGPASFFLPLSPIKKVRLDFGLKNDTIKVFQICLNRFFLGQKCWSGKDIVNELKINKDISITNQNNNLLLFHITGDDPSLYLESSLFFLSSSPFFQFLIFNLLISLGCCYLFFKKKYY